jgi:outer membrane protein OmpA-like peptidoglycan-associated protein
MPRLRSLSAISAVMLFCMSSAPAPGQDLGRRWSAESSIGLRQPTLNRKHQPWVISPTYGIRLMYRANENMSLGAMFTYSGVYNDSVSTETFKIGREESSEVWSSMDIGGLVKMHVYTDRKFMPYLRFGLGLSIWNIENVQSGDILTATDGDGNDTEYKANEIFLLTAIGANSFIHPRWSINYNIEFTYLTGIGADFAKETEDFRSHGYANFNVGLAFHFGSVPKTLWDKWREEGADRSSGELVVGPGHTSQEDSLGLAGVPETDSDRDGVRDEIDLCPDTPADAVGHVDETGCPTDADSDGVPDYLDQCADTPAEMPVDSTGCPQDEDGDGVSDDRDQCPETPAGFPVNDSGCFEKALLFYKRILHIDYPPGGSDIDMKTAIFLDSLVHWMKSFPEVQLEITGYTDNIGSRIANEKLSQKRAERVKSYLVVYGIESNRITAYGKGMTDFIASNETREGRARNRRIELLFVY